jgi:predicted RNase H-like HicB family nuclease
MEKGDKKIYSYSVFYEADIENGRYAVFVPALPGCHSQGDTMEEAEQNIKEAIELYLESLEADHVAIPQETRSFQGTVSVLA